MLEVLAPVNGLGDSGHAWCQSVAEITRLLGFKHDHSDPCLFRRLRGPGLVYEHPDSTDDPTWRREATNADFNPHHVETINPEVKNALLGACGKETTKRDLHRRFEKMAVCENGVMFLGHDITIGKDHIALKLKTCKWPKEVALSSLVGILNWATSFVFGTHQKEVRALASNVNLELKKGVETALVLAAELHGKCERVIYFRDCDNGEHIFKPRTSRVEGIEPPSPGGSSSPKMTF